MKTPQPKDPITAEEIWKIHRAALGGRSGVTGAQLPLTLAECNSAVKLSHFGIALGIARRHGLPDPLVPQDVTDEQVKEIHRRLDDAGLLPWSTSG